MDVTMIYFIRCNLRDARERHNCIRERNNLIEIFSSKRFSPLHVRFNPLHAHGRERSRERSAIGNRLIGIIRQYWQFVAPISRFPFATRRAKFNVSSFFFLSRSSRHDPFSRRDRISCTSALFVSSVISSNSFLQQSFLTNYIFAEAFLNVFWQSLILISYYLFL